MPFRIGFIVGKDNDAVEDPKYVGSVDFLKDLPDKYRVDPVSKLYIKNCKKGTKGGIAHADVAIPWYIQKKYDDIEIDIIFDEEISTKRLQSNMCNYIVGYDVINAVFESPKKWKAVEKAFRECGNMMPTWEVQEYIYWKSVYMKKCIAEGIPMAPTLYATLKDGRSPEKLLAEIKERGWKTFVMKQSFSAFSLGFLKTTTEKCENDPTILEEYFKEYSHIPEYIVQEAIPGFVSNWETRCFWFGGEFCYAIANKAAVSTESGEEIIITGDDIPPEFLENAKRIGKLAVDSMPKLKTPKGHVIDTMNCVVRTDIGCSDTKLDDKDNTWVAGEKTFFLNEIEYGGTNYFIRHLKFDAVPFWAEKIATGARKIFELDAWVDPKAKAKKRTASSSPGPAKAQKKPAAAKAVLKKPAKK